MANKNFILSGKYQLIRSLGRGADSNVFLARHISLESEYAIKIYPKKTSASLYAIAEAQLLRSLHHPGIPFVHDIEEDEENYYLVEEFIQGESLEEYLSHQQPISQSIFYSFCEQLCDIFLYLHSYKAAPVIYQDLKPEHILVCGLQIKLIDFGASYSITNSGNNFKHYGNIDFSAPEYLSGREFSISADIYSIGKMMEYLAEHTEHSLSQTISQIICKAISPDPALRYETVDALWSAVRTQFQQTEKPHLLRTIAIAGNTHGCGATHIAISLVSTLNYLGFPSYYYEKNESGSLRKMFPLIKHMVEKPEGYYTYRNFKGFPEYGPGIRICQPDDAIAIKDYGICCDAQELDSADLILFVCADAIWSWHDAIEQAKILNQHSKPVLFLCNPGSHKSARYYAKQFSQPVYQYVFDDDPFIVDRKKKIFAQQLLPMITKQKGYISCSTAQKRFHLFRRK